MARLTPLNHIRALVYTTACLNSTAHVSSRKTNPVLAAVRIIYSLLISFYQLDASLGRGGSIFPLVVGLSSRLLLILR